MLPLLYTAGDLPPVATTAEPVRRLFTAPAGSFWLLGPRGTGKLTLALQLCPSAVLVDLLDPTVERRLLSRPETFASLIGDRGDVVICEIGRVPDLVDTVRRLAARHRDRRFVLTSSNARPLRRERGNVFSRRLPRARLHPYVAGELGARFQLSEAMRMGLMPMVVEALRPGLERADYIERFVKEEVKREQLVQHYDHFVRFLDGAAHAQATQLRPAQLARNCEIPKKSVQQFLTVLEDLFVVERLDPFVHRARRALFTDPKLFFFDAGIQRSLLPRFAQEAFDDVDAAALEGVVFQHLTAWASWAPSAHRTLGFWRTRSGAEVDFVVHSHDEFLGIDVKNVTRLSDDDLRGALAFHKDYPHAKPVVLYRGTERIEERGVLCTPVQEFLQRLHPSRPLGVAARTG